MKTQGLLHSDPIHNFSHWTHVQFWAAGFQWPHWKRLELIATLKGAHTEVIVRREGIIHLLSVHEFDQILRLKIWKLQSTTHEPASPSLYCLEIWKSFMPNAFCQTFTGSNTGHATLKTNTARMHSVTKSPWSGCQATFVPEPLLPFSFQALWWFVSCCLCTLVWEKRMKRS